ncbi:MAG: S41 family peptidase [Bryobacteraceae bacterium]
MRPIRVLMLLCTLAPIGFAQLSTSQKTADFNQLAALYAKNYAPYELKVSLVGFDLFNIQPWLTQVEQSTTDLEFYDICVKYVASLQDSHDEFVLPSMFEAWLHMDVDIYDGKVLIAGIDQDYLSPRRYPLQIGDEIVSVDGTSAADLITSFLPYAVNGEGNATSRMRLAAGAITDRYQGWMTNAPSIPNEATVVVKSQNGKTATYSIPWDKTGVPLVSEGPVPSPQALLAGTRVQGKIRNTARASNRRPRPSRGNPWGIYQGPREPGTPPVVPGYMSALIKLRTMVATHPLGAFGSVGIDPFDNPNPLFYLPANFTLRLGSQPTDEFVSGTFPVGSSTVGYIRIWTMEPDDQTAALTQFQTEIQYMQQNTDGLIVDIMGNGGGNACYPEGLASMLTPYTFRGVSAEIRATENWVEDFSSAVVEAQQEGAPQYVIDLYNNYLTDVEEALAQNRGRTGNEPLCNYTFDVTPATDDKGNNIAYTKPILVLTDSFTLSAAEVFAMFLQDSKRATIFGARTDGAGGTVVAYSNATTYSEGYARVTESLITRAAAVQTPGFPSSIYYEGIGIYPDIVQDYQTADNLVNNGATFVTQFSTAISNLIAKSKQ